MYDIYVAVLDPKIIVVTRSEADVEQLDFAFQANELYKFLAFSYEKRDSFGNRVEAAYLFREQCRGIFFCAENCLSGHNEQN